MPFSTSWPQHSNRVPCSESYLLLSFQSFMAELLKSMLIFLHVSTFPCCHKAPRELVQKAGS